MHIVKLYKYIISVIKIKVILNVFLLLLYLLYYTKHYTRQRASSIIM